jgi:SAM-dependent methyltransferase
MGEVDRGQVIASAAEVYDSFFVPALFAQWTGAVLDAGCVRAGHRVLDVGCGTGVLARAAHERVGRIGGVVAIDPNDGMLDVARRAEPAIDWRNGVAERLPFGDAAFDRTVSQFALMFFTDRDAALSEIARVTAPDGRIAIAVWDRFENNTGYARLADLLERLFGSRAARALRVPFELGDAGTLGEIASRGLTDPQVTVHRGTARFASLEAWLHTEIRGWTLAGDIDEGGFRALVDAAATELDDLVGDGEVAFDVSTLVVSGAPRLP